MGNLVKLHPSHRVYFSFLKWAMNLPTNDRSLVETKIKAAAEKMDRLFTRDLMYLYPDVEFFVLFHGSRIKDFLDRGKIELNDRTYFSVTWPGAHQYTQGSGDVRRVLVPIGAIVNSWDDIDGVQEMIVKEGVYQEFPSIAAYLRNQRQIGLTSFMAAGGVLVLTGYIGSPSVLREFAQVWMAVQLPFGLMFLALGVVLWGVAVWLWARSIWSARSALNKPAPLTWGLWTRWFGVPPRTALLIHSRLETLFIFTVYGVATSLMFLCYPTMSPITRSAIAVLTAQLVFALLGMAGVYVKDWGHDEPDRGVGA